MLTTRTIKLLLLVIGILAVGGGLKATMTQNLKDFKVSQEVEADDAVPFPVDI